MDTAHKAEARPEQPSVSDTTPDWLPPSGQIALAQIVDAEITRTFFVQESAEHAGYFFSARMWDGGENDGVVEYTRRPVMGSAYAWWHSRCWPNDLDWICHDCEPDWLKRWTVDGEQEAAEALRSSDHPEDIGEQRHAPDNAQEGA